MIISILFFSLIKSSVTSFHFLPIPHTNKTNRTHVVFAICFPLRKEQKYVYANGEKQNKSKSNSQNQLGLSQIVKTNLVLCLFFYPLYIYQCC